MKRLLPLIFLTGCSGSVVVPPPTPPPSLSWQSNGNPGMATCGTLQAGCLTTYTLTDNGVVIANNIPASALAYTLSQLPSAGAHTYALTINGIDQSGRPTMSPPATTTVTIP